MSLNVKLLRQVKERILAEPAQFVMSSWFTSEIYNDELPRDIPNCGTAACIAGWAVAIKRRWRPSTAQFKVGYVSGVAARFLGIDDTDVDPDRLFSVDCWPGKYRDAWDAATTLKQRARVAARRIEAFIKEYR